MKRYLVVLSVAAAAMIASAGARAYAHHSFAATYHEDQTITIEGELVQFLFRNPHSFVHVNVIEKDGPFAGKPRRYAVEWGGAGQLGGQGVNSQTLKVGDKVIISGSPGRGYPKEARVRMVTLTRPSDGFDWGRRPGQVVD
jgi:hypothetical protein